MAQKMFLKTAAIGLLALCQGGLQNGHVEYYSEEELVSIAAGDLGISGATKIEPVKLQTAHRTYYLKPPH